MQPEIIKIVIDLLTDTVRAPSHLRGMHVDETITELVNDGFHRVGDIEQYEYEQIGVQYLIRYKKSKETKSA